MATHTVAHLYDRYEDAARVVGRLEAAGVPHRDISLVSSNHNPPAMASGGRGAGDDTGAGTGPATGTGTGASMGTLLGGGAGLLAGIGALAIPGIGPIVAAGWLVAALTGAGAGAAAGGLLGSLTGAGVQHDDAQIYAEGVRRGGTLVTVRADEALAPRIEALLDEAGPVDIAERRSFYQQDGWTRHDPAAAGYTTSEVEAERQHHRSRAY